MSNLLSPTESRPPFFRTVSATSHQSTRSSRSIAISRTFSSHQKDKPRLYLALLPRGGATGGGSYGMQRVCESYHWALIIGPKSPLRSEAGTAYHIIHTDSDFVNAPYYYEETDLVENTHYNVLIRVSLAKIVDEQRVVDILRRLAPTAEQASSESRKDSFASDNAAGISCLSWVKTAWDAISDDAQKPLKSYYGPKEWTNIETRARRYVKRKRNQGRYLTDLDPEIITWNAEEIPTFNYWENRETTD